MKLRTTIVIALVLLALASWAYWPPLPLPKDVQADHLVLTKSARTLDLYFKTTLLNQYRVSLGGHPIESKQRAGDGRTPEGRYFVDYRKADSSFHRALHLSYPSAADRARAVAQGVDPGGLIMIHGLKNGLGWLGRLHRLFDWTDGCIAVTNPEIEQIWQSVPDGTPIELRP